MSDEIREAKKCLEKISCDKEEIRWAELREKYVREINTAKAEAREEALEEGYQEGKSEGLKDGKREGIREGIKQGSKEREKEIAKNMLKLKIDMEIISKATGLTQEEIKNLSENN